MVTKGIIRVSRNSLFTFRQPVIQSGIPKASIDEATHISRVAFSSTPVKAMKAVPQMKNFIQMKQQNASQTISNPAVKIKPLQPQTPAELQYGNFLPKIFKSAANQPNSLLLKKQHTINQDLFKHNPFPMTPLKPHLKKVLKNDTVQMNREQQLKIQEQLDQSFKGVDRLRHHMGTAQEVQKLEKIVKAAPKRSSLHLPPSLSDIEIGRIYGDLINHHDYDLPKYSTPNTDTNIVSVVFVRHGQSEMNKDGVFQGWIDSPLSEKGQAQCAEAGMLLRQLGYHFDVAYTSQLCRATDTTDIILEKMGLEDTTDVKKSWRLNERHYGHLQGKSKQQTVDEFGKEQVKLWRQSFDDPPPKINFDHPDHPRFDELYEGLSEEEYHQMPVGESLKMVRERVEKYWKDEILPTLSTMGGKQILFSTHKHVLRGMVQYLAELDNDEIPDLIIPNSSPFVFEFDLSQDFKVVKNYYVDDATKGVFENRKDDEVVLK